MTLLGWCDVFFIMFKLFHPTLYNGCNYLSMLRFKLNNVSKRGPDCHRLASSHYSDVIISTMASQITSDCLLKRLFRRRSKNISKLRVTGLCEGNSPVNSPHKGPVTRKNFSIWWRHNVYTTRDSNGWLTTLYTIGPQKCCKNLTSVIFNLISGVDNLSLSCGITSVKSLKWWIVNIGSGNGLVPLGNKPLHEPILAELYDVI